MDDKFVALRNDDTEYSPLGLFTFGRSDKIKRSLDDSLRCHSIGLFYYVHREREWIEWVLSRGERQAG